MSHTVTSNIYVPATKLDNVVLLAVVVAITAVVGPLICFQRYVVIDQSVSLDNELSKVALLVGSVIV